MDKIENSLELNDKDYIREYTFVVLLGIMFCIFVSIITYSPTDPTLFTFNSNDDRGQQVIGNTLGPLGAGIAEWSFQLFGIGAIVFSMIFIMQLLITFKKPKLKDRLYLRLFGYPQCMLCFLSLTAGILPHIQFRNVSIQTGGLIGHATFTFVSFYLGKSGAFIALFIGLISSFTLCLGIRPLTMLTWIFSKLPLKRTRQLASALGKINDVKDAGDDDRASKQPLK